MAKMIPQDLSYPDIAPYQISIDVYSPASPAAVFKVLADHRGALKWIGFGITNVVPTSNPETGVGCTRTNTFFYGLAKLEETFIAWEEPKVWAFTGTGFRPGIFSGFVERLTLEPAGDNGSIIHYRLGVDVIPLMKPFMGIMLAMIRKQLSKVLGRLSEAAVALEKIP